MAARVLTVVKEYVVTVRDVPESVNAGGGGVRANRFAAHREKKRWEQLYMVEMVVAKVDPFMTFCTVEIVVYWQRRHHRDVENYRYSIVKPLADAMVKGRLIKDDTDEWLAIGDVRFEYPSEWPLDKRLKGYMEIKLEAQYQ